MCITDYEIIRELGEGTYGKVYKASQGEDMFAIKVVNLNKNNMSEILREADISKEISKLKSKNFITMKDVFIENGKLFLVYEYVEGGDLEDLMEDEVFSEDVAKYIIKQVLKGINKLHKNGIIHHDIKLENIIAGPGLVVKIVDYGLCYPLKYGNSVTSKRLKGTPIYMAPELLIGDEYSHNIDIWSCGVCLYKLLTGNYPYEAWDDSIYSLYCQIVVHKVVFPPYVSADAQRFVKLMLSPADVRPSAEELLKDPFFL